tara:strand:+ start:739 stop:1596 length:858 start_codon:yes stop_codon:yes gene_type:complete
MDYSMANEKAMTFDPSTLETIDNAVYNFVNQIVDAHTSTNTGWSKVPVLWLGTERPYQVKNNKELRDKVGKLKLPLITVTRTGVTRDEFKGSYQSYYPTEKGYQGGTVAITRVIKQDKTRNFANADTNRETKGDETRKTSKVNKKIVYETITIPKPTYVTCMFEINIRTEYQQQMNDIIPPFVIDQKNVFPIVSEGHQYELFIQDDYGLGNNLNSLGSDERMFTAKIQFKVLGYLVGDGNNRDRPQITKTQNAVEVKISRERVIVGDKRPWSSNISGDDGKFREF